MRGGGETSNSHEDALLSQLYQEVSDRQEPRYAAEYDMTAGLKRYQSWLDDHGQDAAVPADVAAATMAGAGMAGAGMAAPGARRNPPHPTPS